MKFLTRSADTAENVRPNPSRRPRGWLLGGLAAAILAYVLVPQPGDEAVADYATARALAAPMAVASAVSAVPAAVETMILQVRRNDTLGAIFSRAGLAARQLTTLMSSAEAAEPLKKIYPGETLVVHRQNDEVVRIDYRPDPQRTWVIEAKDDGYVGRWENREFERRVSTRQVVIENSLYQSALDAGLSETTILQVAELFGWDIDFALDIRRGDQLGVVFEELWLDGQRVRDGAVMAAKFVNAGRTYEALRYDRADGTPDYFDRDGRSLRKQFLRSPVDFRRISSGFTSARFHPVLGVKRPHRGVDYAASPGTPVRTTGRGKVALVGNKGGYGRTVIVQHGQGTQTLYAHLKGYAKGLRAGQKVEQGQVIGYVGSSGVATGPHLHYEFQVAGVHRNPLTVKLPDASPLPKAEHERFALETQTLRATLDLLLAPRLAQAR
jgi:murein DD-endopeptidase MepM/ murein hydrolase activator NlpD